MARNAIYSAVSILALAVSAPTMAKDAPPPVLAKCETSLGSIALVDGDTTGWTAWGLGHPRQLINALAIESGCFTPHNQASGQPARFLITVVAGSEEEIDRSVQLGKGLASEALVRSGAGGALGGALGGAMSMFGGKKKTYAAGLRVVNPANGLTMAAGTGSVKKSSITFGGSGGVTGAATAAGYLNSKEGKMLTEAFVIAFNTLVDQRAAIEMAPAAAVAAAPAAPVTPMAKVAVATAMRAGPSATAASVRSLRVGAELAPTGKREGLFIEVKDSFGTTGWVSVEDMN
jgi:FAD/FMN-containing dehydrogenase